MISDCSGCAPNKGYKLTISDDDRVRQLYENSVPWLNDFTESYHVQSIRFSDPIRYDHHNDHTQSKDVSYAGLAASVASLFLPGGKAKKIASWISLGFSAISALFGNAEDEVPDGTYDACIVTITWEEPHNNGLLTTENRSYEVTFIYVYNTAYDNSRSWECVATNSLTLYP